ncbi:MAG TPA: hypothetical protein VKE69_08710, partial [Planctomycetota bacterium]|nr:hypothetical protein [Planctomycetota bacterium]
EEDRRVYASSAFVPDLNHAPRPWTGKPWPASGDLAPAGAKAFARDVESLAILARAEKAAFVVALPESPDFAGFARAVSGAVAATPAAVAQVLLAR